MSTRTRNQLYAVYNPDGEIVAFTQTNADLSFDDVEGDLDVLPIPDYVDVDAKRVNPNTRRINKKS